MAIVVFGSINMDLVVRTPHLPSAGETLTGHTFFTAPGGKGANQAVACSRLGALTRMIGRVGDDAFGGLLRESLRVYGVNVSDVTTHPGRSSGVAMIAVDDAAENQIIIVPGANGMLGSADLAHLDVALTNSDSASDPVRVLLLQLEIPLEAVFAAAQLAHQQGVTVILDPAPACPLPPELYALIDILTPNAIEAATLVGFPVDDENTVAHAAKALLERGVRNVIIKLGGKGVYWTNGTVGELYPAFPVESVDTVGAGDAFNGGLAVALNERHSIGEAITWGLAAGALSVTRVGAQPSMPNRDLVMQMLAEHSPTKILAGFATTDR